MDAETLTRIRPFGVVKHYRPGQLIHNRGDPATHIGIVLEGGVVLSTIGRKGRRLITAILLRGELYGAYPMQAGRPRTLDAEASGETQVLAFSRSAFRQLLDADADFRDRFIMTISEALERAVLQLDDQRRLPVVVRLAKQLLRHSRNPEQVVAATQSDLAQMLAVSRNAVGMSISELSDLGFVEQGYGRIRLPNRDKLRRWVEDRAELARVG